MLANGVGEQIGWCRLIFFTFVIEACWLVLRASLDFSVYLPFCRVQVTQPGFGHFFDLWPLARVRRTARTPPPPPENPCTWFPAKLWGRLCRNCRETALQDSLWESGNSSEIHFVFINSSFLEPFEWLIIILCKMQKHNEVEFFSVSFYHPVGNTILENKFFVAWTAKWLSLPQHMGAGWEHGYWGCFLSCLHTPLGLGHRKMSVPLAIKWRQFHILKQGVRRWILYRSHPLISVSRGLRKASLRDGLQWMWTNKYSFP